MSYSAEDFSELARALTGPFFRRGDEGMAGEVAAQNTLVQHDPEVAVGAETEADVVAAVRFATAAGMPVHVLATGHGGWSAVTSGVLITTARLSGLQIDPDARIAAIGAGNRWSAVVAAAAESGLAPVTGASGHVGTIGYTLGGGLGPLARTFGFSSDYVRSFRLVTAAGEAITVSGTEHPELFWALRGGKGGFGVVTSMEFALVPLRSLYAGSLFFDAEHIAAVLRGWAEFTSTAPESVTTSVAVLRFPPLEVVPEPLRGTTAVSLRFAFVGPAEEGERMFAPLRALAPSFLGGVGELPAADVALIHNDPTDPVPMWDRGMLLDRLDAGFAEALLEVVGPDAPLPMVAVEVRHLGGAASRDVAGGSAVGGRSAAGSLVMIGAPDPALFDTVLPAAADAVTARLAPWISASNNINFAGDLSAPGSYESCWPPEAFARLAAIRATYDPTGTFPYPPTRLLP
ncbi:FAD-binding oxidoreductase [Herbiconiux sp. 11R-BC]|uniref:FAD-binding oxidoreductase n=1 Tax=Herbiconiux sp. 11R-BC TaxID=3111637 RepID=UPI003C0F76D8